STKAFAHYVRGSCHRCFAGLAMPNVVWHAQRARDDLAVAESLFSEYAERTKLATYAAYANICRGAALEMAPMLGLKSADEAVDTLLKGVEHVAESGPTSSGAWLESWGWWCIFGCNVAARQVGDEERLQSLMATFTRAADTIARRLGNWALRERVWTLELERERRAAGSQTPAAERVMTNQDVKDVAGTMARFPVFR